MMLMDVEQFVDVKSLLQRDLTEYWVDSRPSLVVTGVGVSVLHLVTNMLRCSLDVVRAFAVYHYNYTTNTTQTSFYILQEIGVSSQILTKEYQFLFVESGPVH